MKLEFSAGGVVTKLFHDGFKIVLCLQTKLSGAKVYCLPKGHIEPGETFEITAIREVYEETGIEAKIIEHLSKIDFFFTQNNDKIHKTVHFFLMECISENFSPNEESEKIIWCSEDEALKLDPYKTEKDIIKLAFEHLKKMEKKKNLQKNSPH